jgi:hypothetical protein
MLDDVGGGGVRKKNARRSASERAEIVVEKNIIIIEINSRKTSLHCGFNGSLQHRLQISLLVSGIARSFLVARLAGVRQR